MEVIEVKSHWNERWQKIEPKKPTFRTDYFISDYGRIKSVEKATGNERILPGGRIKRTGHVVLRFRVQGNLNETIYVHKFVAEHFVDHEEDKECVVHIDLNKNNNHYKNLKWLTRTELVQWLKDMDIYDPIKAAPKSNMKMTVERVKLLKKRLKENEEEVNR